MCYVEPFRMLVLLCIELHVFNRNDQEMYYEDSQMDKIFRNQQKGNVFYNCIYNTIIN